MGHSIMITVTDRAKEQMCVLLETKNEVVVRYELEAGGCSGLNSRWSTEPHYEPAIDDFEWFLTDEYRFVIDKATAMFMENATIDYGGDFMPAFKVDIPDRASCGCNMSFAAD